MRITRVIGGLAACAMFATRCALFPDLSGLAKGPDATAEAGTTPDATSDAPDAAPLLGCKAMMDASFCEDFDDPSPFAPTIWSTVDLDSSVGTISLDDTSATSPPNAASFVVPSSAPGCSYLRLTRRFLGTFAAVKVHAAIRMATIGNAFNFTVGSATNFTLLTQFDDNSATVRLQKYDGVTLSDSVFVILPLDTTPIARWLALDMSYVGSTHQLTVTLGNSTKSRTLPTEFEAIDPGIGIGPYCSGGATSMTVDDVSVYLTP